MVQANIPILIAKLVAGGLAAFFVIILMAKTHEVEWLCFCLGVAASYAGIVFETLSTLGILSASSKGILILSLAFAVVPSMLFAATAILLILKN